MIIELLFLNYKNYKTIRILEIKNLNVNIEIMKFYLIIIMIFESFSIKRLEIIFLLIIIFWSKRLVLYTD